MDETARDSGAKPPRLLPSCHQCGAPLACSPVAPCPRCIEQPRQPTGSAFLRLARWRLRTLILLVALVACASAWGVHARRRQLADDRGQFYTHEEMARYQGFLKAIALDQARQAEGKVAAGGGDRQRWAEEAA